MVVLVTCFSCTNDDTSIELFLSVTLLVLVLVRCFSYAPHASFNNEFYNLDHTLSKVFLLVTLLMPVLVRSFSCTPDVNFSEELL